MTNQEKRNEFASLIDQSSNIVFFTGAGISTESGIPDFRSPGTGIWNKISPIEFQDFVGSEKVRKESWKRKFGGRTRWDEADPNVGHKAICHLIQNAKARSVITQNVDNLHQKSGVPDEKVIELHGNAGYAKCLSCGSRFDLDELKEEFERLGQIKPCRRCGGIIKTATISFGQPMPEEAMQRAQRETIASDLFVVVGSSLVVYPAAGFPELATSFGIPLVIVNREPTPLDSIASLVIHDEIGPTFEFVLGIDHSSSAESSRA
ncbi:MAG: Sir2 family NAD-dependent protein deacetylase [Gammaproteobacteria bacterium]|nr:Sir2 family NAD-dependent protein deacetylase [Gammaproteobacteria bacterium]